jgi:hypothetical protein
MILAVEKHAKMQHGLFIKQCVNYLPPSTRIRDGELHTWCKWPNKNHRKPIVQDVMIKI